MALAAFAPCNPVCCTVGSSVGKVEQSFDQKLSTAPKISVWHFHSMQLEQGVPNSSNTEWSCIIHFTSLYMAHRRSQPAHGAQGACTQVPVVIRDKCMLMQMQHPSRPSQQAPVLPSQSMTSLT